MLTLWRPQKDLFSWSREFDDLFNWTGQRSCTSRAVGFTPAVDIEEKEDHFVIHADLPGVKEKDISLSVHDGSLTLAGKREEANKEEKKTGGFVHECRCGSFERSFRLGPNVDSAQIAASYKDGVLAVTLPKKAEAKPRQIQVKAN